MEDQRANSVDAAPGTGADLHLDLANRRGRADLVEALHESIRTGRLPAGTRLPSSRSLAKDLGIARNTVADAYGQLVAEGWLTARQGSGTVVAGRAPTLAGTAKKVPPRPAPTQFRYDLTPGSPDVSTFPRTEWLAAARKALPSAPNDAFGYGDPRGRAELREKLADYLARARGVRADPERIMICSGYIQALNLLSDVLRVQGATTMSVEEFGYDLHWDVIRSRGLEPVPVPVDEYGVRADLLTGQAAFLTPAHQMPTGVPLAPDRRAAVIEWARETGALLIEDDYDGEFRYDRQPVGALQALDPERVVYTGTASKSLAPALRLAWMVLPDHLMEPVLAAKRTTDLLTATLDQLVLAEFIASGHYDRHVRRSRLHYRRRRDRLVELLAVRAPGVKVAGISAGLHVLLDVPGQAAEMVERAARQGLAIAALDRYRFVPDPDDRQAVIVGYGTPPDHAYSGALDLLCQVLAV
ncbi:GntR family transcriptional regulator/MocR family aminotransferase [Kribbella voronezhensis]|uniref:GntR family transcriptional regulator/MocR family aminotransferase n=1 Tax=Kribbella voronezhensis TaxID=2512212 RepID=A0A4R7SU59_9ACTN|nr:PLP-dependent aminotransferase family protein [Kribbella voronezhensis]TDU82279.1 GntR family transcriptional regulator/MocR family aminotransferase [Kribbella voronezhensis]